MDPDENLPWPNPELIQAWWKNKGRFRNGTRYLCGQPITHEHLQHVLRTGFQRQRAAAAIELAMLKPGQPLLKSGPGLSAAADARPYPHGPVGDRLALYEDVMIRGSIGS